MDKEEHLGGIGVIEGGVVGQGRVVGAVEDVHHCLDEPLAGVGYF